jgi:hypothetical protein
VSFPRCKYKDAQRSSTLQSSANEIVHLKQHERQRPCRAATACEMGRDYRMSLKKRGLYARGASR